MFRNEIVIAQMRIGIRYPGEFFGLSRRERFIFIETPDSFQQSLTPKDFVQACNAAFVIILGVEEGSVGVGDFYCES